MPEGAIYVGRPTRWGNPFKVGDPNLAGTIDFIPINQVSLEFVLIAYERWAKKYLTDLSPLRGKDLACWCPVWECDAGHKFAEEIGYSRVIKHCPKCGRALRRSECHADILLELASQ